MLNIDLITPTGIYWHIEGTKISLPGKMGTFQILSKHINIISVLTPGKIIIYNITNMKEIIADRITRISIMKAFFYIEEGIVEFHDNLVIILGSVKLVK